MYSHILCKFCSYIFVSRGVIIQLHFYTFSHIYHTKVQPWLIRIQFRASFYTLWGWGILLFSDPYCPQTPVYINTGVRSLIPGPRLQKLFYWNYFYRTETSSYEIIFERRAETFFILVWEIIFCPEYYLEIIFETENYLRTENYWIGLVEWLVSGPTRGT